MALQVKDIYISKTMGNDSNGGTSWADSYKTLIGIDRSKVTFSSTEVTYVHIEAGTYDLADIVGSYNSTYLNPFGTRAKVIINADEEDVTITNTGSMQYIHLWCDIVFKNVKFDGSYYLRLRESCMYKGCKFSNFFSSGGVKTMVDINSSSASDAIFYGCKFYYSNPSIHLDSFVRMSSTDTNFKAMNCQFYGFNVDRAFYFDQINAVVDVSFSEIVMSGQSSLFQFDVEPSNVIFTNNTVVGLTQFNSIFHYAATASDFNSTPYIFHSNSISNANRVTLFDDASEAFDIVGDYVFKNHFYQVNNFDNYISNGGDQTGDPLFETQAKNNYDGSTDYAIGNTASPLYKKGANDLDIGAYGNNIIATSPLDVSYIKIGIDRGDGQLGTYDGSDRWSDAGENNVRSGVPYKANSETNNKNGNLVLPDENTVLNTAPGFGSNGTEYTPSYYPDFPEPENVASDDTTNGVAGTMDLPPLNKVAPSATLRGVSGTMDLPDISSVLTDDTLEGISGTADVDALSNLPSTSVVLIGSPNFGKNLDLVPSLEPDFAEPENVLTTDTTNGVQGTYVPDFAEPENVLTTDTTNGVQGTYTPDFPEPENVASDDTTNGVPGTMDLPPLNKVAPSATLRGVAGTMDLPDINNISNIDTLEGVQGGYEPAPETAVQSGTTYGAGGVQYTGSLIGYPLLDPSVVKSGVDTGDGTLGVYKGQGFNTFPTQYEIKKDVAYLEYGVSKLGLLDLGYSDITPSGSNKRMTILNYIQQMLMQINPDTSEKFVSYVQSVSIEAGNDVGDDEIRDLPHIQIRTDEWNYNHKAYVNGDTPEVDLTINLRTYCPSTFTQLDLEQLIEDIEEALIQSNYNLGGNVIYCELNSGKIVPIENDEREMRIFEIKLDVKYVRSI